MMSAKRQFPRSGLRHCGPVHSRSGCLVKWRDTDPYKGRPSPRSAFRGVLGVQALLPG